MNQSLNAVESTSHSKHDDSTPFVRLFFQCPHGGTGRRARLKILFPYGSVGSIPTVGTKMNELEQIRAILMKGALDQNQPLIDRAKDLKAAWDQKGDLIDAQNEEIQRLRKELENKSDNSEYWDE